MQKLKHSRFFPILGLLLGSLVWLANNNNPPTGKTGAPFNGNCNDCHAGGNFNGTLEVTGFPATADPDVVYDIKVKLTTTVGSPTKAGFQLVVVDANNNNCGDLVNIAGNGTGTENLQSREYMEHRNGKNFAGGSVSWDFQWKAPLSVPGNTVKAYYIVNMCNGNGGTGGDNPVWDDLTFAFAGTLPVTASISSKENPTCNGGNNGSATVEATGGTPPYTYLWTGGQTTQTAINLTAGTYTVTVTASGNSGSATAVATLTQPAALTLATSVNGTVTCVSTATATATAGGGVPGYTYLWSDGQTSSEATFDLAGTYTVTATDANGCTKATTAIVPGNTTPPTAMVEPGGTLNCIVVQIPLSGAGSSTGANISYLWTTTNGNIVSGANTLNPVINACGTYTLTVTNNTNGCTASASTTVTCNTTQPNATATGDTITCNEPGVTLVGSSTTPNVTFTWSGPGITPANQFLQNPVVEVAGTYSLTVTNPENGCTKVATATVTANNTPPTAIASVSGTLTCSTTSVSLNLSTDAQNPTFLWLGPNGFSSNIANPGVSIPGIYIGTVTNSANGCQNSDTITVLQDLAAPGASAFISGQITCVNDSVQLSGNSPASPNVTYAWTGQNFNSNLQNPYTSEAGTFTLTVTANTNGCTSTAVATVTQNTMAPFDSIVPPANLNCNNAVVQLNATPSSQGPNFHYHWTAKEGGHIVSGDSTLTPVVDSTGKYFLVITNSENGCTSLDSVVVKLSPVVTATITSVLPVSCHGGNNGAATASGNGGNGVFSYQWSNGDTTATASNLTAGTYLVTVTDGEDCSTTLSVTLTQPDVLQANGSATGETALDAKDGTATAAPTGGSAPYTYLWSNNSTTQSIADLAPGNYTLSVTDTNGCTVVQTVTVNAFGCTLQASASVSNTSCNGSNDGLASVSLTGAVNPVTYLWSNGETTQSVNNLAAGMYTVSVLDGNGCPAVLNMSISEPPVLAANATANGVSSNGANDGSAAAIPTGGTPDYTYLWSNNETTQTITGLAPGAYTVVITDANGCTSQQAVQVDAFNCAVVAILSSVNVSCNGGADAQATVAVSGGVLPYSYLWSNGSTTQTITNLQKGTYSVTASDASGCVVSQTVTITEPDPLVVSVIAVQNVLCPQDMTGSVQLEVAGGIAPYSFSWPNGNSSGLGVGNYTVSITDANNCFASVSFSIVATDQEAPVMTCPADIQICGANFVDYAPASAQDNCGIAGAPIRISGPPSGSIFNDGTSVIVYQATDVSGNTATCAFTITVNGVPDILIDNVSNDVNGQNIGAISVTPVGNGGFTYAWNKNGQTFASTEDLTGLGAGAYTLTITDVNGCTSALAPILLTNTVGTSEPGELGSVRLWPNPAHVAVQLEIIDLEVITAQIMDLRGGLVKTIQPEELTGAIEIQELPEGMYCLLISTTRGRVFSLKFLKH